MIVVVETTWIGLHHVPANVSLLRTIARALPGQAVHFFAEHGHRLEVAQCLADDHIENFQSHTIILPPPDAQPLARLRWEAALIRRAITQVDDGTRCLIVTAAATGTNIAAANLVALRLGRWRFYLQHCLHGNLNELQGWRSRNPLMRAVDLRSALTRWHTKQARYIVLEGHIRDRLAALLPTLKSTIDVVPETIHPSEREAGCPPTPPPIRVGYLGLGTRAKGFDLYLRLARAIAPTLNGEVEFHAVGNVHRELAHEDQSILAQPLAHWPLARRDFVQAVAKLHYVVLPYQGDYYRLSASGTLVDALRFGKPIISTNFPFVRALFDRFGDIGFLCDGEDGLGAILHQVPTAFRTRYQLQKQAIANARQERSLAAGIAAYRRAIDTGFPGMSAGSSSDR